jgi:1,4-dihydroxy-6-naphthoate synthase
MNSVPSAIAPLTLGFSSCPNDTFIFHALVRQEAGMDCPACAPEVVADVETLNRWALAGRLDVTKLSFHALGHVLDRYVLLTAGSALGRGCGPLLVAGRSFPQEEWPSLRIAVPGRYTTAALLLRLFAPEARTVRMMRFDEIMPAIAGGEVDAGVIIHESRFTYQDHGLVLLQDLGAWWEQTTGLAIPLGGIAARRSLGRERLLAINRCLRASLARALADPAASLSYVRGHARELNDRVIRSHIELYVNEHSLDLGETGLAAVREFLARGRKAGILPRNFSNLALTCEEL